MRSFLRVGLMLCGLAPFSGLAAEPQAGIEAAEVSLSASLEQNPKSVPLHSRRGDVRLFLGRFAEAVKDFERMIELDPQQDAPHWRLGIAYYFAGEFEKSARQFAKYHSYDGRDRENGIWKFMAQFRAEDAGSARAHMLEYPASDRAPFVELYEMFAGKRSAENVVGQYGPKSEGTPRMVQFFALYYAGVYTALTGDPGAGLKWVKEAVALFTPDNAAESGAPGYMWQVARVHAGLLEAEMGRAKPR